MPLDGLTLSFLSNELRDALVGGRIDRIVQPERDELNLTIRNNGQNYLLLLSAGADCARAHLTAQKKIGPLEAPALCMLMRKHVTGGRISDIRQIDCDRILEISIDHYDELGERATKKLICEFMGKHSNLIFLGGDGRIIDSARRVNEAMSSVREVLPGLRYELPPSKPMRFALPNGRIILVGRNNLQNDKLTFTAHPDEIWLHAKDMPGSHAIIIGENPDDETIRAAAQIAAAYSKGAQSSNVPVDYTLRKYVKKPSGARPGFVIFTHQKTLYVHPDPHSDCMEQ